MLAANDALVGGGRVGYGISSGNIGGSENGKRGLQFARLSAEAAGADRDDTAGTGNVSRNSECVLNAPHPGPLPRGAREEKDAA